MQEAKKRPRHPRRYSKKITDAQLCEELWRDIGNVICNPWAYEYREDKDLYVAKDDRGEWYTGDEVRMLKYLIKKGAGK